jgi:pyruvate-formate lyase
MKYEYEKLFTDTYIKLLEEPAPLRELACLRVQFPAILEPVPEELLIAGGAKYPPIGFSPKDASDFGYYCRTEELDMMIEKEADPEDKENLKKIRDFWQKNQCKYKTRQAYPEEVKQILPSDDLNDIYPAYPLYRMTGCIIDYDKLLKLGLPGMKKEISEYEKQTGNVLYTAMLGSLEVFKDCLRYYEEQCEVLMGIAPEERAGELKEMRDNLIYLEKNPPKTFWQAAQLAWLYSIVAHTLDYGRMDVYLGDFMERDLKEGILEEAKAFRIIQSIWRLIADKKTVVHGRVMLGGRDRKNVKAADHFAMLAMEASNQQRRMEPQLSLRCYREMNPEVFHKALETLGAGATFPILYNDDVNILNVQKAFGVTEEEAQDYYPYGCGEYILGHKSFGSANGVINLARVLELTLSNGRAKSGELIGPETGAAEEFKDFESFYAAYLKQLEYFIEALAIQEKVEYEIAGESGSFLFLSMLYDDCIKTGKSMFDGGIRYLGGTLESYGNITTADSLTAINNIVYQTKQLSMTELRKILESNYEGFDLQRLLLLKVPKFGNDDPEADGMAHRMHDDLCEMVAKQAKKTGLSNYLPVLINNDHNVRLGKATGATPDGRRETAPLTNANSPSGGSDRNGITALLNSMTHLRGDNNAGMVQNLKLGKTMFHENMEKTKMLIRSYFDQGGTQLMITVVNPEDLKQAMIHPELYTNLFVRVGGYSGRFIGLPRDVQLDIISRTAYE